MMAHMKDFPAGVISPKWTIIKKFWKDVETETTSARKKFTHPGIHLDRDVHDRAFWLSVITEEIGKLCRTVNKLNLRPADERIVEQWTKEGYHRIITSVSLLRRLAEAWDKLPNERKGQDD